jgi:hypothetical protein
MSKVLRRIADFWRHFSAAERHQIVGAACFLIALCYGLLLWYPGNKSLGELIYKEQKQNKRNSGASKGNATLQNFNLDGLDVQATRREFAKVQASLAEREAELSRLSARFMPLDDLEALQQLKSELTRLAESGDMEVTALEHIPRTAGDRPPTVEELKRTSARNRYKRPLLRFYARASYRGLMAFLDGLPRLSQIAAPVWSRVTVRTSGTSGVDAFGNANAPKQWLEVEIHFAI